MILWLEDRLRTAKSYALELQNSHMSYETFGTMSELKSYLGDTRDLQEFVFIIDIMFPGVNDLSSIQIDNAPTDAGNWAGYVFAHRYLRAATSEYRKYPLLFLTERMIDDELKEAVEALAKLDTGPVTIMDKFSERDLERFIPTLQEYLQLAALVSKEPPAERNKSKPKPAVGPET